MLIFWVVTFFGVTFNATDSYDEDLHGNDPIFISMESTVIGCSANYSTNASTDALSSILDFVQGTVIIIFSDFFSIKFIHNEMICSFDLTVALLIFDL